MPQVWRGGQSRRRHGVGPIRHSLWRRPCSGGEGERQPGQNTGHAGETGSLDRTLGMQVRLAVWIGHWECSREAGVGKVKEAAFWGAVKRMDGSEEGWVSGGGSVQLA